MANTISNQDDTIDSRDVIARIEELEELAVDAADPDTDTTMDDDEREELRILKELAEEGEASPDWRHGETLIRASYFEQYAYELADDCGMLVKGATWPNNCIDWEKAARELQYDYTSIDFDGVEYWIRS